MGTGVFFCKTPPLQDVDGRVEPAAVRFSFVEWEYDKRISPAQPKIVMAGLCSGHPRTQRRRRKTWIPVTSTGMTSGG